MVLDALVAAVRAAPVDRASGPEPVAATPDYILEFRRSDGTSTRRRYRPATGELASIVIVPEDVRLVLLGLVDGSGTGSGIEVDEQVATLPTTAVAAATTATTLTSTTTPEAAEAGSLNDAESTLRFDFGAIVGTSSDGEITWIQFDRYQLGDGANGPELTEEIRIEGATDLVWANMNARLRWYRLAPGAEVLELEADWFNLLCDGEPLDVEFVPSTLNRLLALDARLVSLTFNSGEVVRVRDQRSC